MNGRIITHRPAKTGSPSRQINIIIKNQDTHSKKEQLGNNQRNGKPLPYQTEYAEILKELDEMIGLRHVKDLMFEIYALLQVGQYRAEAGLQSNLQVYHMVFKGNPGTGKTTVARIVARLFQVMGVLGKGHMIEAERADLVGEYIGHTAQKTRDLVKKSLGGILFIDEAYSLARGGDKDFGKEAIDTLVKAMEDYKNQFILILAGYSLEMEQFLLTNPGLPSRFPIQLHFPDYSMDQLMKIANKMITERDYTLLPSTEMKIRQILTYEKNNTFHSFSNARYVRNLLEKSFRHQAVRLLNQFSSQPSSQELMAIRPEDIQVNKSNID